MKNLLITAVLVLLLVGISSCSTLKKWTPGLSNRVLTEHIDITRVDGANDDKYLQVDLVVVFDKTVNDKLVPDKADQWFIDRASFLGMSKKQLRLIALEPVPISKIDKVKLPGKTPTARRVMVFVAYHHLEKYFAFDVTKEKHVHLVLADKAELELPTQ